MLIQHSPPHCSHPLQQTIEDPGRPGGLLKGTEGKEMPTVVVTVKVVITRDQFDHCHYASAQGLTGSAY